MWVNAVALALFPTIVSLVTMAGAIRRIGSTPTAILGALEPVTALFFGVAVFGERFTLRIGVGVSLILVAVTLIIAGKSIRIPHLRHAPGPMDGPSAPASLGRALGAPPAASPHPPQRLTYIPFFDSGADQPGVDRQRREESAGHRDLHHEPELERGAGQRCAAVEGEDHHGHPAVHPRLPGRQRQYVGLCGPPHDLAAGRFRLHAADRRILEPDAENERGYSRRPTTRRSYCRRWPPGRRRGTIRPRGRPACIRLRSGASRAPLTATGAAPASPSAPSASRACPSPACPSRRPLHCRHFFPAGRRPFRAPLLFIERAAFHTSEGVVGPQPEETGPEARQYPYAVHDAHRLAACAQVGGDDGRRGDASDDEDFGDIRKLLHEEKFFPDAAIYVPFRTADARGCYRRLFSSADPASTALRLKAFPDLKL